MQYVKTRSYRPSNGVEGEWFERRWCERCARDEEFWRTGENPCPIHNAALFHRLGDGGYPDEWVVDEGDSTFQTARCTAFVPAEGG